MGDDAHMIDDMTPREMYAMLRDAKADFMLSGGRSQFIALQARMPWLDINQERHHPHGGYEGIIEFVHEIDRAIHNPAIHNPVWRQMLDYVSRGEDEARFVYRTDAALVPDKVRTVQETGGHQPVTWPVVALGASRDPAHAKAPSRLFLPRIALIELTHRGIFHARELFVG